MTEGLDGTFPRCSRSVLLGDRKSASSFEEPWASDGAKGPLGPPLSLMALLSSWVTSRHTVNLGQQTWGGLVCPPRAGQMALLYLSGGPRLSFDL